MELFVQPHYYYGGFCLVLALAVHVVLRATSGKKKRVSLRLPPGPWQLPLIGSLHHLLSLNGALPHCTMRDLSRRHGPLMLLRLCERATVVVSSADVAREVFHRRDDAAFEQRPGSSGVDELYARHGMGIIFAPYGEHWRRLRRVLVTELLGARRVNAFRRVREGEAARLAESFHTASSSSSAPVNVDERLAEFVADSAVRAIAGDRLPARAAFLKMMEHALDFSSVFCLRDLFPSSRLVRMLPRSRKAEWNRCEAVRLMDDILKNHEERRKDAGEGDDDEQSMVDVLLRIQKEGAMGGSLTNGVIMAIMLVDVFTPAIETTTSTLRWAMAELVANPRVMEKARSEICRVLAGQEQVHETFLSDLSYLKAVIKETIRLHPPVPLVPRVCSEDRKIQGYDVPKGTIVLMNVWAITRDPKYWDNPDKFMPERFESERAFNFLGSDFEFIPFGAGRRICPGMAFSQANIEIALASLLYHYDWELPAGVKPEDIDMTESPGLTVKRKAELLLHPIPRIGPSMKCL